MKKFLSVLIFLFLCFSLFAASSGNVLAEWNKLSEDEKWLCLLSEPFLNYYNISRTTVNPEPQGAVKSTNILENDWGLYSKNDVLNCITNYKAGSWCGRKWWLEQADALLKEYPDASIDEIAKLETLEIWQAATLCFYAETKDKLGTHGALALDIVRLLGIIRCSVAVGWFTETEAVGWAKPLMSQLLNAYDSLEDLSAHFAFGWYLYACTLGFSTVGYSTRIAAAIENYSALPEFAGQPVNHNIKFPAKNQNNNRKLTSSDIEYIPGENAEEWYILRQSLRGGESSRSNEENRRLTAIKDEKADIPCVALLNAFGRVYYSNHSVNMLKMQKEWNSLSENEKWLCLLSEPLMVQNSLSITTVNPEKDVASNEGIISLGLLRNSWGLYSREDVLQLVEDYRLKKLGHGVVFTKFKEKLKRGSIEQLAIKECLKNYEIARMYFVSETQNVLGFHGLLAWDYGRILSILRWSVASGWISEMEAVNLAQPFIDELIEAYDSWEDYAVHYAFGRVFYAVSGGMDYDAYLKDVLSCIKKYDLNVPEGLEKNVFTFHNKKFPGKNRRDSRILKYPDAVYEPSKKAASWILAVRAENNISGTKLTENDVLNSFLKQNMKIPAAAYLRASLQANDEVEKLAKLLNQYEGKNLTQNEKNKVIDLYNHLPQNILNYFDGANPAFKNVKEKSELYYIFYTKYAFIAYQAGNMKKMDTAVSNLNEEKFNTADLQYMYCIYYTQKAKDAASSKKYESASEYAKTALYCLKKVEQLRYFGLISNKFMQDYEEILGNLLDECRHNLQGNEVPLQSA